VSKQIDHAQVRKYLAVIKKAVAIVEAMLEHDDGGLLEQMAAPAPQPVPSVGLPTLQQTLDADHERRQWEVARKKHIADLMAIDCWPPAVAEFQAVKAPTRQDQINRANAVLDKMIDRNVEGKAFLDYGCGEGWITQESVKRGFDVACGYDIHPHDNWGALAGGVYMHSDADFLRANAARFDVVMLYDVLDHCENPQEVMGNVKYLLKKNGVVYVRCHPWIAKHATHVYKQGLNRAYIHMFLNPQEVEGITGVPPMFTRVEKAPLDAYRHWFGQFEVKKEVPIRDGAVSEFFHVPAFKDLLRNETGVADIDGLLKLMEIQFVDYVLVPR
jgi:SAM-dependent methyltransferase